MVELVMNELMRPTYDEARALSGTLRPHLATVARAGLFTHGDLVLVGAHRRRLDTAPDGSAWDVERFVNGIALESTFSADDPRWRADLVSVGLVLGRALLEHADGLTAHPVQITLSLQSAPHTVDPDIDFASGHPHLTVLRSADDDFRPHLEQYQQTGPDADGNEISQRNGAAMSSCQRPGLGC